MSDPSPANDAPKSASKIVLHHLNNSRSQRILWLLEELEVPYEIKKYQRTSEMLAPKELKDVHVLGKAPVITDGDLTIAESGAIVEYLITRYGGEKFKPTEAGWVDNLYFTHYAEGSIMPLLVIKLVFTIIPQRTPFFIRPVASLICNTLLKKMVDPQLLQNRTFIEEHLAKCPSGWFASGPNPTAADFMMIFPLEAMDTRIPDSGNSTAIHDYVKMVHERLAYKRAAEKGGEFQIL
ncbi:thioredoxin-like protein [Fomitiporia mediterranea MF3/22]|uniref:thioredoxin-like protein n=1 Tax=Fomitiporia mediterranea (strain MF3/22) TaxID=694068 RepID=UPI00044080D7|nr:thioredoxin-like protein [Fomitiporia mediterranea MF3/22]EJD05611.1 thioredoxin-like protein [Fomitiporia mediterranea MF3/22]